MDELRHAATARTKEYLLTRPLLDDLTSIIDQYLLPERIDIGKVVRHQEDGNPPMGIHLGEFLPQCLPQAAIKCRKWLIEEQESWLHGERSGQRHPLLLSPRELAWYAPLEPLHAKEFQEFCDALRPHAPWGMPEPKGNIVGHSQMGKEGIVLWYIAQAALLGREVEALGTVVEWLTIEQKAACIWLHGASNDP